MHLGSKTSAAIRSGHGGMFIPPGLSSTFLTGDGLNWSTSGDYWVNAGALGDTLLDGHDWDNLIGGTGHESYVIYSRTRRAAGATTFAFDVTAVIRNPVPTWLRSRKS